MKAKCFACGKPVTGIRWAADTHEDQAALLGPDCWRKVRMAGAGGYQPPKGGPRLFLLTNKRRTYLVCKGLL